MKILKILVLNSGSSSLKYQVIDTDTGETLVKGNYERIGQPMAFLTHKVHGEKHKFEHPAKDHKAALEFVMSRLVSKRTGIFETLDGRDRAQNSAWRRKVKETMSSYRTSD